MEEKIIQKILHIDGMTCANCEMKIENVLKKLDGVAYVNAIYSCSNVYVTYDVSRLDINDIVEAIEKLDYKVKNYNVMTDAGRVKDEEQSQKSESKMSIGQLVGLGIIILALYTIIKNTVGFNFIPQVDQTMGYGILFAVGLMTSLHCVAMCGGINLSVCINRRDEKSRDKYAELKPGALYNLGRILSYTFIGGIVGAIGSVIGFSGTAKGLIAILSGVFMVIMGINMLNVFPVLRKLNPRMPKVLAKKVHNNAGNRGPLFIGMLSGLMPCGPLQAMQLYALGTGSFAAGAISMFIFSLGTVPLMFGFGAVSSLISGKFTHKMMKVSSVLVIILGIIMLNRGLGFSGYSISLPSGNSGTSGSIAKIENGVQTVTTTIKPGSYEPIVVQKGVPVKWTIKADKENLNGCNNAITAREFGIENRKLNVGDNIIEFIPDKEGNFIYTCWMGMIRSSVKVVSNVSNASDKGIYNEDGLGNRGGSGRGCCGG